MAIVAKQQGSSLRRREPAKGLFLPPTAPDGRPSEHHGIGIDHEELIMHLPNAPLRIARLHLVNGEQAYACRDCTYTGDTRGQVMIHRNDKHGTNIGRKKPKVEWPKGDPAPDLVLPPRTDGVAPTDPLEMRLGEFLALAPSYAALGDLIERIESERDAALAELDERRRHDKVNQHKIDAYEGNHADLVEMRQIVTRQGNYDAVKAEMYALRAWKKKMIAKLSGLGFQLNEEEQ